MALREYPLMDRIKIYMPLDAFVDVSVETGSGYPPFFFNTLVLSSPLTQCLRFGVIHVSKQTPYYVPIMW